MQRIKRPRLGNKIDLADPGQVRAWTRRLAMSSDELKAIVRDQESGTAADESPGLLISNGRGEIHLFSIVWL